MTELSTSKIKNNHTKKPIIMSKMKNENTFDTGGLLGKFHQFIDTHETLDIKFDGVLLGFEKIKSSKLSKKQDPILFKEKEKVYELDIIDYFESKKMNNQLKHTKRILNHPKTFVLTHSLYIENNDVNLSQWFGSNLSRNFAKIQYFIDRRFIFLQVRVNSEL